MKHLIFDTETSGLPEYRLPADHPDQPRLAQFAGITVDDDMPHVIVRRNYLIKPDGWVLQPGAAAVNGLTMERLEADGMDLFDVLQNWSSMIMNGYQVYAYGAQFDCKVMRGELRRSGMPDLFEETKNVCLMRACMGLGIEKEGPKKGGYPKLTDACRHFGIEHGGPHQAEHDVEATYQLFLKLRDLGRLPEAGVHHAREGSKSHEALLAREQKGLFDE